MMLMDDDDVVVGFVVSLPGLPPVSGVLGFTATAVGESGGREVRTEAGCVLVGPCG